jgi:murein DD-endopeptidase MepM/ murein hydrolase activator NlpD
MPSSEKIRFQEPKKDEEGTISPMENLRSNSRVKFANVPASTAYQGEFKTAGEVLQPLEDLRAYMTGMDVREAQLLDSANMFMAEANKVIADEYARLSIEADKAAKLSQYQPISIGGPYIAASSGAFGSPVLTQRMTDLSDKLETWETLKYQVTRLPLAMPMTTDYFMSSGFGLRRDPFKGKTAMHSGSDFGAPLGSPIVATAPGKVVKAGWNGGYGRMVEIRHDNGVTTRYAHLSKFLVRAGQSVKRGDIIGRLGNSGRSTGPHLHYETRVGGRALDPRKFWKARDVFQEITR